MTIVNCPFCKKEVKLDISRTADEDGEVHICPHCGKYFRWVEH